MDEFDLDFSNGYSTSIDSLKNHDIKCESNKCQKYSIEKLENIDKPIKPFKIKINDDFLNTKIIDKNYKQDKSKYDFYLVLLLFLYVNNYSFLSFLHKFRINYYTSLLIRMLIFGIFYYFGNKYLIRMNKYDLTVF
jgi:hypothetical protein